MANGSKDELFGHPKGLYVLFFAELWERFSFYGMRGLLILYMTKALQFSDQIGAETYGAYTGFVYATPFFGGILADRFLGRRKAILIGGTLMAFGHFALAVEHSIFFYEALALIIVGNGFFKPNISTLVGTLYKEHDPRRDGAFTIFYMGINVGAFLSGAVCGPVGELIGWHYGFGLAGVGMVGGLLVFTWGQRYLGDHGLPPRREAFAEPWFAGVPKLTALYLGIALAIPLAAYLITQPSWITGSTAWIGGAFLAYVIFEALRGPAEERGRIFVILILTCFSIVFWACFEQAGSSMNLFTDRHVDRGFFGWEIPTTMFQSVNPAFIMALSIPFAWLWLRLGRRKLDPSSPLKFALGLLQVSLGFVAMVIAAKQANADPKGLSHMGWLVLAYFFHTTGELCLSPVGLSMVTKLAPARLAGMLMGMWFLSNAFANVLGGWIAGKTGAEAGYQQVFQMLVYFAAAAGVVLLLLTPILKRLIRGAE